MLFEFRNTDGSTLGFFKMFYSNYSCNPIGYYCLSLCLIRPNPVSHPFSFSKHRVLDLKFSTCVISSINGPLIEVNDYFSRSNWSLRRFFFFLLLKCFYTKYIRTDKTIALFIRKQYGCF